MPVNTMQFGRHTLYLPQIPLGKLYEEVRTQFQEWSVAGKLDQGFSLPELEKIIFRKGFVLTGYRTERMNGFVGRAYMSRKEGCFWVTCDESDPARLCIAPRLHLWVQGGKRVRLAVEPDLSYRMDQNGLPPVVREWKKKVTYAVLTPSCAWYMEGPGWPIVEYIISEEQFFLPGEEIQEMITFACDLFEICDE